MKESHKKSKILFIAHTNNLMGGGELSVVELIKSAKRRGYRPHVVVPGPGDFAKEMRRIGVESTAIKYFYWGRPYSPKEAAFNLAAVSKIVNLIKERQFECVITNTLTVPWGALAAAISNKPHIWIAREKLDQNRGDLSENYDFVEALSNAVFANSKDNANYLKNQIGLRNARQFYSYVDPGLLNLNSTYKKPRIINLAAHIRPSKDQLELVKALGVLNKRGKLTIDAIFVGHYSEDDEYFKKIKSLIKDNNLGEKISFVGFHTDPFKLIGPNDIFVRSSKYESLGRTITEAMKLGLIVVAADIPSSKEAFQLGGGVLYRSGDPIDLAGKLQEIISRPDDYKKMAEKAKERALKTLSEKACHDPFFGYLDKMTKASNPRAELRHIFPQLMGLVETLDNTEAERVHYKKLAEQNMRILDDITKSKSWRMARRMQRVASQLRKPAKIIRRNTTN